MIAEHPAQRVKDLRAEGWKVLKIEYALPSVRRLGYTALWVMESPLSAEERLNIYS